MSRLRLLATLHSVSVPLHPASEKPEYRPLQEFCKRSTKGLQTRWQKSTTRRHYYNVVLSTIRSTERPALTPPLKVLPFMFIQGHRID